MHARTHAREGELMPKCHVCGTMHLAQWFSASNLKAPIYTACLNRACCMGALGGILVTPRLSKRRSGGE